MSERRSVLDHLFGRCVGFFLACVLVYGGVQLLRAVIGWLVAGLLIAAVVTALIRLIRWRRDRWY